MYSCSRLYWKITSAGDCVSGKKIYSLLCPYIWTPLVWTRAPKHQAMQSTPCRRSINKQSFRKVRWFVPLTERKYSHEERRASHFSICSHCSKERPWPFQLWSNSVPHKELPYIQIFQNNMSCSWVQRKSFKCFRNWSWNIIGSGKTNHMVFNKIFSKVWYCCAVSLFSHFILHKACSPLKILKHNVSKFRGTWEK